MPSFSLVKSFSTEYVAIIVTYNPDIKRLEKIFRRLCDDGIRILVVDNFSKNYKELIGLVLKYSIEIIENYSNLGISKALNLGISKVLENDKIKWILLLDQDTVVAENYIEICLKQLYNFYENIPKVWVIRGKELYIDSKKSKESMRLIEIKESILSGSLVKREAFKNISFREDFFMDFVDTDFFRNIYKQDHILLLYDKYLLEHVLGEQRFFLGKNINYEPIGRLYSMIKNSTILFFEKPSDYHIIFAGYIGIVPSIYFEGIFITSKVFLKAFFDALISIKRKKTDDFRNFCLNGTG